MIVKDVPQHEMVDRSARVREMGSTFEMYFSRALYDVCVSTPEGKDGSDLDVAVLRKTIMSVESVAQLPTFLSIGGFPFYVAIAPHCDGEQRLHVMLPYEAPKDMDTIAQSYLINVVFRELRFGGSSKGRSHRIFLSRRLKHRCKRAPLAADGTTIERQLCILAHFVSEQSEPLEWSSINGVSLCSYRAVGKNNVIYTYYMLEQEGPPEPVDDEIPF